MMFLSQSYLQRDSLRAIYAGRRRSGVSATTLAAIASSMEQNAFSAHASAAGKGIPRACLHWHVGLLVSRTCWKQQGYLATMAVSFQTFSGPKYQNFRIQY